MNDIKAVNASLQHCFPELASSYAVYPLALPKWTDPRDNVGGQKAFLPSSEKAGLKPDYVYGSGRLGKGYYHLTTKDSYRILTNRCNTLAPTVCCFTGSGSEADIWDTTRRILQARLGSSKPDDGVAHREGVLNGQNIASIYDP